MVAVEIYALVGAAVFPTWTVLTVLAYRQGKRSGLSDDVEKNRRAINSLSKSQERIEYKLNDLERQNRVIHDIIRDENHCGADDCEWCDPD